MENSIDLLSTGPFIRIPHDDARAHVLVSIILRLAPPPLGLPCTKEVVCILRVAVQHTVALLHQPTKQATDLVEDFKHLVSRTKDASAGGWLSSPSGLIGKKVSNPVWFQLGVCAAEA